ncbi:helix-turn-helix domain-containing protein [Lactococcus fujiensis]|uniref:HTH cro/C1-type domain-containing protein n=2 Tax=Lactococcus fujiensis TaxID=610251 RepID=A0A2A5RPA7_9LACT|nr:helix-turn-helix transcriptional regulator [Lactococcus fujiensis]PCS01271.1 hypothetical protein RT41_GL000035 [Lactococcus fujiensis JCM 16395]
MMKNDEKKVAELKEIRATLKTKRITTIELAKQLHMDSANLSDYLFFRKFPTEQLISEIIDAIHKIELVVLIPEKEISKPHEEVQEFPIFSDDSETNSEEMNENMTSFEYSVTPLKLGDKIKNIRIKLSLSQEDLAALLKPPVAVDTVKFWENNFGVPLLDYCVQISDLGVVTLDWLLKD